MSLAVLKKPVCRNCQYNILQSFAAIVGIPLLPGSSPQRILAPELSQRWYTQTRPKLFGDPANSRGSPTFDGKDENSSEAPADTISSQLTLIPWYLQVDVPKPPAPSHSLAGRQMIPELPENPPTILSPILNYLSIDSGLDNLSLIDLRHLNPPPALGANLLMIIGTARSVKHLNVSADRFCRWLRNNYQIRPYADGLLGRNELKLKLRRKARRQKLAQSVGNTLELSRDDGITTGWVCVNLGSVKGVRDRVHIAEDEDGDQATRHDAEETEQGFELSDVGYIGFGSRSTAPRIVVQMFTEEKRAEMDLEGLWEARTTRRTVREEKLKAADDTQSANDIDDEQLAAQSSLTGFDVDPTASREDHDQPRPFYATAAS